MNLENFINKKLQNQITCNIKNKLCINILKTVDNSTIYPVHYNLIDDDEIIEIILNSITDMNYYKSCVYGIVSTNVMTIVTNIINNNVCSYIINNNLNTQSISIKAKSNILKALK